MRTISNKALTSFSATHPDARLPTQAWRAIVESRTFANFAEMKTAFNTIDKVGDYYVFDIGGNKYRIVSAIHFTQQKLFIRHVFTHKEYDKWKP
jgi:mRNA interferase HigB